MPVGGYCEACGRWVWVRPNGSCESGHPPNRVREVQQLLPLSSPGGKPLRTPAVTKVTPYHVRFWWRHSNWILLTLTLGFFNWLAFVYISLRARQPQWLAWGFVYLLPLAASIAAIGSPYFWYAVAVQMVVAVVSFVHAVTLRPRYRALMFGDPPLGSVPAPPMMLAQSQRPDLGRSLDQNVAQTLREAYQRVGEMSDAANRIAKPETRRAVARLCVTAQQILAEIQKRPDRVDIARGFLTYYLDAAARIVAGYEQLVTRAQLLTRGPEDHGPGGELTSRDTAGLRRSARVLAPARPARPRQRDSPARQDRSDGRALQLRAGHRLRPGDRLRAADEHHGRTGLRDHHAHAPDRDREMTAGSIR